MEIAYLIFIVLFLIIASIALMFRNDDMQTILLSFALLVVAGSIVTMN